MREQGEVEGMRRKEKQNERERENERGGQGPQREGQPDCRWWAKSGIRPPHWGIHGMAPSVCWHFCFHGSGSSTQFPEAAAPPLNPLLVLLLFTASPRSQGLREACAPDASGLLRQLLHCYLRELMQGTFNTCRLHWHPKREIDFLSWMGNSSHSSYAEKEAWAGGPQPWAWGTSSVACLPLEAGQHCGGNSRGSLGLTGLEWTFPPSIKRGGRSLSNFPFAGSKAAPGTNSCPVGCPWRQVAPPPLLHGAGGGRNTLSPPVLELITDL